MKPIFKHYHLSFFFLFISFFILPISCLKNAFTEPQNTDKYYNILTLDGGGIRGIIPAVVLQKMEAYAWDYASEKGYQFPKYPGRDGALAMKDLFNMTAGTSTGSILAAGLVYPVKGKNVTVGNVVYQEPGFFAKDLLEIYATRGGEIFVKAQLEWMWALLYLILFVLVFSVASYLLGRHLYDNPEVTKSFRDLRRAVQTAKRVERGQTMIRTT